MLDLRTSFTCQGSLRYPDGSLYRANGRVQLVMETKIRCIVELELQDVDPLLFLARQANLAAPDQPEFIGITHDGHPVSAKGLLMLSQTPLIFSAGVVSVGTVAPTSKIRFFIPNLDMTPRFIQHTLSDRGCSHLVPWTLSLPRTLRDVRAEFYVRPDIQEIRKSTATHTSSVITAALTLENRVDLLDWNAVEEPVYRLCLLLSLALGRHINWAVTQGTTWWLYRSHIQSGWAGRGALVWIQSFPESVTALLDCWPTVCDFSVGQAIALRRALNLYLHSGPSFEFPVPFYCTAGAFEILCTAFLENSQSGFLPSKQVFRKVRESFENWAAKHFAIEITDKHLRTEFEGARGDKFNGINGRSLRARIIGLARQLDLAYSEDQVGRFIKLRNSTTHGAELAEQDEWDLLVTLAPIDDLLVRVLLRLVGYSGEYWGGSDGFGTLRPLE